MESWAVLVVEGHSAVGVGYRIPLLGSVLL